MDVSPERGAEYRYPFVFSFFAERLLGCLWLHECCAGNACGANDERILFVTVRPGKTYTLERGVRILVAIANGGSVSEF